MCPRYVFWIRKSTFAVMNGLLLLLIVLVSFLVLLLAFFALSSCLGDDIRAAWAGQRRSVVPTTYGLQYARVMGHGGTQAGWEHIEMEDMLDKRLGADND
ncbi:hypothetical protein BAUCODRAFT_300301 [Baudoinia panamericana UAMH 10762]|uniref:Uncharacterized protein n=1 Tax=Baudoinia panamericana (strain UAMH 10762) TaxID=717646 RepID=M2MK11_BAUPA|nr:uncharacterized protein BAUCODRAFT_300301 [Baudoinia panamericana UAMH 10762]EMC91668.1 hypothetical protein BAUCODRAFT_300301 [Baudoinia panamericana UAMH 10762]